jgi:hypothetical protein
MWTLLWTSLWTSTTESGVHDNHLPHTPSTEKRLVCTVAEEGEMLGISRAFAYEPVARGELPVIRLSRRRLVPNIGLMVLVGQP